MHRCSKALLGVSFDNVTLDEAAQKILLLINMYAKDRESRYVCTVNVDFFAKALAINWNDITNPELLDIYRRSDFVTCDGKPLIWLSRLLGGFLKERVSGSDLVPKLAGLLAQHNKSIYLLGSTEQVNKVAGLILEAINPGLRIVGHSSPAIATEGGGLLNIAEQDILLIEEINRAAPDVLLIALGNPKQEKWFDRIRDRLKVPVSIGVGSCLEFIAGAQTRAPVWMQKAGLEWFYRLLQEPKRLWKRYFIDIWKFFAIAVPLVMYHTTSRILYWLFARNKSQSIKSPLLFLSATQTIAMIPLPTLVDEQYCHLAHTQLDEVFNQDTVILDFERVCHITLEGFSLLLQIWKKAAKKGRELYAINVSGDLKLLMKVHRAWDLIKDSVMNNPQQVIRALIQGKSHPDYFDSIQQEGNYVVIYFFGRLSAAQNTSEYIDKLTPLLREKDCVLDFSYCTHIENAGFAFLLKLSKIVALQNHRLFVRKRSPLLRRLFRLNGVHDFFPNALVK